MNEIRTLDITPSPRLLQVLGDIPLAPWQCIAELVDNSLDELPKLQGRSIEDPLLIQIEIQTEGDGSRYLVVSDNGAGMSQMDLERALRAGHSSKGRYGTLGLFGMGFNIATARMGNVTQVSTTCLGSREALTATIDFQKMQREESFHIPVEVSEVDPDLAGTSIKILLHRDMGAELSKPKVKVSIREQLGDVYSFMLRSGVPGMTHGILHSETPVRITLDGVIVQPRLPCVWRETRFVTYRGQHVEAIQYVDKGLPEATACLDCGYWDKKNGPEICEECGSRNLEQRERRIWGWVGIQRYLDTNDFGIDFLRYGRKIRLKDKSPFVYVDPDTLKEEAEYPIEMPANRGRIVGEIHLDHVPVNYQKTDFVRDRRDWQVAMEFLRGESSLKPRRSGEVNESPLARLFNAYRRNEAGLKCLIPGSDEGREIHNRAREWGDLFHKGVERFQDDSEWFKAVEQVQEKKDREARGEVDPHNSNPDPPGEVSAKARLIGEKASLAEQSVTSVARTQKELLDGARILGTRRDDLGGSFKLGNRLGDWNIEVWVTKEILTDDTGSVVPSRVGQIQGNLVEIFIASDHPLFSDFGRSMQDVALITAADLIKSMKSSPLHVSTIYTSLVQEIDDLKVTTPSVIEHIGDFMGRLRNATFQAAAGQALDLWKSLGAEQKLEIEVGAAIRYPNDSFSEVVDSGNFLTLAGPSHFATMIAEHPECFFDGLVFKPSYRLRNEVAQKRIVGNICRALEGLSSFEQDDLMREKHDKQLVLINLDMLSERLISEE